MTKTSESWPRTGTFVWRDLLRGTESAARAERFRRVVCAMFRILVALIALGLYGYVCFRIGLEMAR